MLLEGNLDNIIIFIKMCSSKMDRKTDVDGVQQLRGKSKVQPN